MRFELLNDLFNEASEVSGTTDTSIERTVAKTNGAIELEIKEDDSSIAIALKELINNSGLTIQDIYDKKTHSDGYNMIYSLRDKNQLGIERLYEWCAMLGKKPVITFVDMTANEKKEYELKEKERQKNKKRKTKRGK